MSVNAYQMYRKTQVSTASQGDLLIMLFDGAIKFVSQARQFLANDELEQANDKIIRAQDIVMELIYALDMETGEIAQQLNQVYSYIYDRLVQSNVRKDLTELEQASHMLTEMRDTWRQVVEKAE